MTDPVRPFLSRLALEFACPRCYVRVGEPCRTLGYTITVPHAPRMTLAIKAWHPGGSDRDSTSPQASGDGV